MEIILDKPKGLLLLFFAGPPSFGGPPEALLTRTAWIIGNTDGIGLALTRRLLRRGWQVTGLSRSESNLTDSQYEHHVADVTAPDYPSTLERLLERDLPELVIYCAGIGQELDLTDLRLEARTFEVNLVGMVKTAAAVIPLMVNRKGGHFIGLSSLADELVLADSCSYCASKAGFSSYLAGLSRAVRKTGVAVTNVRFGFVDTKMAKGSVRPLMLPVERAVDHLERCIRRRPARHTAPKLMIPLVKLIRFATWLGIG